MPRGYKCPFCDTLTLHLDKSESFRKCSDCEFVGWWLTDPVKPGQGRGRKCVNCHRFHNALPYRGGWCRDVPLFFLPILRY